MKCSCGCVSFYGDQEMRKFVVAVALTAIVGASSVSAWAQSTGRVGGSFGTGALASFDDKAQYIRGTNVWCAWRGSHVIVHVTLHNSSVETITATVKPRYYIARGSEHGSSFLAGQDFKLAGGKTVSTLMDAGHPKNTPTGARIGRCAPYLYLVD
jgi:hypothetical protein